MRCISRGKHDRESDPSTRYTNFGFRSSGMSSAVGDANKRYGDANQKFLIS